MTPAAIVAAIESLSGYELERLLESSEFWNALAIGGVLLECADTFEIVDELAARCLTPDTIERLRALIEDSEEIEQAVTETQTPKAAP
jgi:hypothetical protein